VPDVPAGLSALVARLMAKRPEDRPDSAGAVRTALAPLLRGCGAQPGVPVALRPAPATVATSPAEGPGDALLLHGPDGDPSVVLWGRRRIVLGKQRTAGVDLVLRDYPEEAHRERIARVSRRHAAVALTDDGGATVEDLGSANGTSVDGAVLPAGTTRRLTGRSEVVLAGVATLMVRPGAGAVVLERPSNRPDLRYVLAPTRISIGADGDVPLPGAATTARLEHAGGGWTCDGRPLGDRIDLGGLVLRVRPLGDFL
jgi:hypothetical protein